MKVSFSKSSIYGLSALLALFIFVIFSIVLTSRNKDYVEKMKQYELEITYDPFENLSLEAESAYVFDTKEDTALFSIESDEALPLASITKFMTVLTAAEALPPDFPVEITPESLFTEGESGLYPFERWKFEDLAAFTLIVSSNDGAQAIANAAEDYFKRTEGISFVEKMNKKAEHLSMRNSRFYNPTGLDESLNRAGAYSTAQDVTKMLDYMIRLHPGLVSDTQNSRETFSSLSGFTHVARNTNQEIDHIPGITASKTGFTDLAGGNLVIAAKIDDDRTVIITALASTKEGRFSDTLSLYRAAQMYYQLQDKARKLEQDIQEIFEKI